MKRRKYLVALLIGILLTAILPFNVYASLVKNGSLTIYVENPPQEKYYLDLLTQVPGFNKNISNIEYKSLDQNMVTLLDSYKDNEWYPSYVGGTNELLYGELVGEPKEDQMVHKFKYSGLPETYRIIIVTESGEVSISEILTRKVNHNTSVTFDFTTGRASLPSDVIVNSIQFLITFVFAVIIEGLLLLIFRISIKKNWAVLLIANGITQLFLIISLGRLVVAGTTPALITSLVFWAAVIIMEVLIYVKWMKSNSGRKLSYGIIANLVSLVLGHFILNTIYLFFVRML